MSLVIQCPHCSKRYQVADSVGGKRVRCQQCKNDFVAPSGTAPTGPSLQPASDPINGLAEVDFSRLPALPQTSPLYQGSQPLVNSSMATSTLAARTSPTLNGYGGWQADVSNPSGGPTDFQMRLVCCGMLVFGAVVSIGSLMLHANTVTVYLAAVGLVPLMLVLGIAGLISPNIVRAAGKYGGHLPLQYKVAGYAVLGLSFLLIIGLLIGFFMAGFEPDRPGSRNKTPGLNRSETAKVHDTIRQSFATSPNANVVRNVSFPVLSFNQPNPELEAERVLGPLPGYVAGSFRVSADRKTIAFQYRGEQEIANQYAILLPGPTGIYMFFTPEFAN